ncbi:MAG: hypothetical protein A2826_02845 [Candidatus Doudnabacteria bacterium RIFCSPHIGHO2_01_FULL_43_23]|uniref:Uncharacterized protein n=1 Tax=Candidatus Doudnabacteria bacterium RIFCSPHIGHO2_01_FULL_43_23 TaxID=1817822 RepID=A0A1F5NRS3_9BACT|nr:MAG: hypothetical protein A2826_02845 [Candidatus Doudnabacteria bacterium RIFCSPHIGHO2_01_FULL_43_23]
MKKLKLKIDDISLGSQEGITLISSILVLASVTVVSFSIGALTLRELRASRQLSLSEPAINSAEAAAETALFFRLREINQLASTCPTLISGSLSTGSNYEFCSNLYDDPYYFNTASDNVRVVLLYNPADNTNPAAGYTSITITATSGTAVNFDVDAYDINAPGDLPKHTVVTVDGTAPLSPVVLGGLDSNKSYAVFLDPGGSSLTANGTVNGTTGSITGIPSESPSIEATGIVDTGLVQDLRRKLEIFLSR